MNRFLKKARNLYWLFFALLFSPLTTHAQNNLFFQGASFCDYMRNVFNFATVAVGTVTIVMVIVGGLAYATSAGNPERLKSSKDIIVSAIAGMVIALGAYLIFQTIAPNVLNCKSPQLPSVGSSSSKGFSSGSSSGANFAPVDKSLTDMCQGKQTFADKAACDASQGSGGCLKGKAGTYCRTTCGDGASAVAAFRQMQGMCIITNHCAFTTNQALQKTGCPDFSGISSTTSTASQLKAWGYKEYSVDLNNQSSLNNLKPGAVLIFEGHTGLYTGNGKFIDAVPGYYSQCGSDLSKLSSKRYGDLIGKDLQCAKKNPWNDRNPTVAGNENKKTRTGYTYTKLTSKVQCVAEHNLKGGRVYSSFPLLSYYVKE